MATGDDRVGLLFWEMTLNDDEFNKKVKKAEESLDQLDTSGGASLTSLANSFNEIKDAGTSLLNTFKALSIDQIEVVAQTKILADSIGATTAEFEGLTMASEQLVGDAGMVIDKMREFGGIDDFKALADDVKNAGSETEQLAKAVELFGGEGAKMLPVLQLGADGLKEFEDQALATGRALSPEETEEAAEAYRQWNDLVDTATGLARKLGVALGTTVIPVLKKGAEVVGDLVTAIDEIVNGFNIWIDEILGIEDPLNKGITAEELLEAQTAKTNKELKEQAGILKDLGVEAQKTFESDLFAKQLELDQLDELQKELGLTEKGLSKIAGMASAAFGRGETVEDIVKSVGGLRALRSQKIFDEDDFVRGESLRKTIKELKGAKGKLPKLKIQSALMSGESGDSTGQEDFIKKLMGEQSRAPQFAEMASAGSLAEYKILNQKDEKTQKDIEKNTAKIAKLLESIKVG